MADHSESLAGKVAIVTGASRGIGRAIAVRLGRLGAKVVLNYCSNEERAQEALQAVKDAGAADACAIRADVSKSDEAQRLVATVLAQYKQVDILINNAGVQRSVLVHKMTDADWHEVMDINLSSAFYLARAVFPNMIEHRYGQIINVGSASGFTAHKGSASYCASKYGLIGLTKVLALEGVDKGIRVNGIAPGGTDTDMLSTIPEAGRERLIAGIPMKRLATADEIASMVIFVLTEATYSTGNFFHASGGIVMA